MSSSQSMERVGDTYALRLELATEKQRRQLLDDHLRAAEDRLAASASNGAALRQLQHDYKLLHEQNEEALAELAARAEDRNSLLKAHSEAVLKAEAASNQLRLANSDNQKAQQEIAKLKRELSDTERSLRTSEQLVKQSQTQAENAMEAAARLREEIEGARRTRDVDVLVHQEVASRQALLSMHEGYLGRLLAEMLRDSRNQGQKHVTLLASMEEEETHLRESLRELQGHVESLAAARAESEQQKQFLRGELEAQASVVKDLRDAIASLSRTQKPNVGEATAERSSRHGRTQEDLQDARQLLEKCMKELEDERAMSSRLRLAMDELRLENPSARLAQEEEVAALRQALTMSRHEVAQMEDKEARLVAHVRQVTEECRLLHAEAEVLGRLQGQSQAAVRRLEAQVAELSAANGRLVEEKRRCSEDIKALEQRVEEILQQPALGDDPLLKAKNAMLTSELEAYKETIGRMQDHLRAAETDRIPLLVHRQHMQHYEAQTADLEKRVGVLQQRCQSEAQRCQKLQAELDAKEEENMRLAPQHEMRRRIDLMQKELDGAVARLAEVDALRIAAQKRLEDERINSQTAGTLLQEKDRIVEGVAKQLLEAATEIESLTRERDEYRRIIENHRERDKRDALFALHRTSSQHSNTPLTGNSRRLF
jgi:chromosome segregation ATPase